MSEIAERFRRTCRDRRRKPAVYALADGRCFTFDDLAEQFERCRRALARCGAGPGVTVVSRVGARAAFFPLFAAALDLGAVLAPVGDPTDEELDAFVRAAGASVVASDRPLRAAAREAIAIDEAVRVIAVGEPAGERPSSTAVVRTHPVVLKLTSGSTDLPKAAVAREPHLLSDGRHVIEAMGIGVEDVNLACIPLSHSYSIGNIVMPLILQGTAAALRPVFNLPQFGADVDASGATVFPGVPFMFDLIRESGAAALPRSLRLLITAGARIDPSTVRWFHEHLDRKIHSFYGSSETGGIAYDDSDELTDPLHVGRSMPETRVELRTDPAAAGRDGEGRVFVRGPAVVDGYAGARDDAAAAFDDGGFLTSDLAYFDGAGRMVLTGRISPLINVAGMKVDPGEVERTLAALDGIAEARVLGMPDARRGQQLVAVVVPAVPDLTAVGIRQRCAGRLSSYKIPRRFVFVDRLPRDARGKIDRRALEALAAGSGRPPTGHV